MSSIPDFRRAKATTHENVEVTTNESTSTDVNNVFGSDMTTDAETDAETGTIAAREKSIQKELIKNLEEEYVEINSYREKLMINIANYGKILNQIDFGSVEDENPSEGVSALYDRLEEHKRRMLLVISDNHMDIKSSIKAIILKQVLNKRAVYVDISAKHVPSSNLGCMTLNKIINNPIVEVRDTEFKLSNQSTEAQSDSCRSCGNRYSSPTSCTYCISKKKITSVEHTHPFNKKLLTVLYTQINSVNIEKYDDKTAPVGTIYNRSTWQHKLFSLFSHEKIQRYETP